MEKINSCQWQVLELGRMSHSPYAAVKIPDFRLLLAGRLLVTLSVQIQILAVGWQMYELTKNPLYLGFLGLSEAIPALSVALYAGHVADVVDRRHIIMWASALLSFCMFALCGGSYFLPGDVDLLVGTLFAVVAISGFGRGFYGAAIFGMISQVVPRELYGNAAAWNTANWQSSAVLGPIIGGFIYLRCGPVETYGLCGGLLVAGILCFLCIKSKSDHVINKDVSVIENIKEGLRFVFSNEVIWGSMAVDLFAVLFGGAVALLPIFVGEVFKMGPEALGFLRAAPPVGALLTAALFTHRPLNINAGKIFLCSVAGFGVCMIAFGLSTNYYVSFALLAISGALDGISVLLRSTIYQLLTPDNMKGRFAAVNNMFIGSSNEIGSFESGVAAKIMGLVPSVVFGGCMTLLVVITTIMKAPNLWKLHMQDLYEQTPRQE